MLNAFTLILVCQLAGELITGMFGLVMPGPVLGMVFLFLILLIRGHVPENIALVGDGLLRHLSLLFVPAGVGVMLHAKLLSTDWLPIGVALLGSTILTITVTGLAMRWLGRGRG